MESPGAPAARRGIRRWVPVLLVALVLLVTALCCGRVADASGRSEVDDAVERRRNGTTPCIGAR